MTMLHNLRSYCRLFALVASWVLSVFPLLSAQNSKELMADACSNELHQREQNVLWASQVERRTAGHVYREENIDTVEGPVHRLLSVDGREPSPSDRTQDDDRLRDLRENPSARLTLKKNREAEEKKRDDLLRAIPDVFLFQDQGKQGNLERQAFSPIQNTNPRLTKRRPFTLVGVLLIDLTEKQVAQFSGTLTQQVNFAHRLLGHLNKGGMIEVNRVRLSPGLWGTSLLRTDLDSRALFKSINRQVDETRSDFEPVLPDTNIQPAGEHIVHKSAFVLSTGTRKYRAIP
jgi:hypothetical protein